MADSRNASRSMKRPFRIVFPEKERKAIHYGDILAQNTLPSLRYSCYDPVKNSNYNSSKHLHQQYENYIKSEDSKYFAYCCGEVSQWVLFLCFFHFMTKHESDVLYPGSGSWMNVFLPRLFIALVLEPFGFVVYHLYLHMNMLQGWQCGKTVVHPYAFYHHYVDPRMYSRLPLQSLTHVHCPVVTLAAICFLLLGVDDNALFLVHFLVTQLDLRCHIWCHTADHMYNSWNPLSPSFRGAKYVFHCLEALKCVNRQQHHDEHHKTTIETQHLTSDWVDFSLPGVNVVFERCSDNIWRLYLRLLKSLRNSHLPEPIPGYGREEAKKFQKRVVMFWVLPSMLCAYWVMNFAVNLFPVCFGAVVSNSSTSSEILSRSGWENQNENATFEMSIMQWVVGLRIVWAVINVCVLQQDWELSKPFIDPQIEGVY